VVFTAPAVSACHRVAGRTRCGGQAFRFAPDDLAEKVAEELGPSEILLPRLPQAPPCGRFYTSEPRSGSARDPPINWLMPVTIVLLASLALAAVHFLFTRWLARQSEPIRTDSTDDAR